MRKRKFNALCLALTGALSAAAFVPATAFAQTPADADCICEDKCTEGKISDQCPVCWEDMTKCQGKAAASADETGQSRAEDPLTPDGNMNLVDDYGKHEETGKQFLTVTTRDGKYFYLIIDRDDNGAETVHFLNQVDAMDLLSLLDEDQQKELKEDLGIETTDTKTQVDTKPAVETQQPNEDMTKKETAKKSTKKKSSKTGLLAVLLILVLCGVGGYFYIKTTKGQKKKTDEPDPDADYTEDDEDYLKFPEEENSDETGETKNGTNEKSNDEGGQV